MNEQSVLEDEFLAADELALKQRELILLRAKAALIKNHGIEFYRPSEKQHLFHIANAKRRGVFAGNRFGKSECSAAETVAWFLGERTWYKHKFPIYGMREGVKTIISFHDGHENHPFVRAGIPRHATKQLIVTTDWKKVNEVWTSVLGEPPGKLWKFLPASEIIDTRRNHEGVIDTIFHKKTNAVIRFTTEQAFSKNPQSAESTDNDRVGIDEPICEDMWKAMSRGLVDRNGQADFTLTSLRERWIYDYFFPEDETSQREDRWAVRATIWDNPFNPPEAVQRFLDDLTEEERSCRAEGLPLELTGLVYKEFRRERHVLKPDALPLGWTSWDNPPSDWTIYVSIDVHPQTNQAVLFVAVPKFGVPIVYDEIWRSCTADDLAAEITSRLTGRTIGFIKCDPKAWEEDPVYRVSMAQRFQLAGLQVEPASKAKTFGILNMNGIFRQRPINAATGLESATVLFAPTVKRTLWEISRYHYDKENKPIDKDDHFMECMYRIFINPLSWIDVHPTPIVPDFTIPMTSRAALREFDYDRQMFDLATSLRN